MKDPVPNFCAHVGVTPTLHIFDWVTVGAEVVVVAIGSEILEADGQEYVVVVVVKELPAWIRVSPTGQLESETLGLVIVRVANAAVANRSPQVV
jgi:hypothetical protein